MLHLIDLPTEILIKIFQYNSTSDNKYQLITLSKATKPIIQPIAYQHITLTSHQSIRSLTKTLRSKPELALLIRSITLVSKKNSTATDTATTTEDQHQQNYDESMIFFAFTALLRHTHHITHLQLDLEGSNVFELTQLFQAISQSRSSTSIRSLIYRTRAYSSISTEPDLTQLVSSLTSLTSLSIIGNTRYSNSFHHHHHHQHHHRQHQLPVSNITHHTPTTTSIAPSYPNQRGHPCGTLTNHSHKLLPPIKSLTTSSSRLTSNSTSNIHKLIKLCSSTLTELTICGVNESRRASLLNQSWTQLIENKIEKLTLIGSFFHGEQQEESFLTITTNTNIIEILNLDWCLLISNFKNLTSLNLINDFNWLDSIPILIPITSTNIVQIFNSNINQVDLSIPDPPTASSSSSNNNDTPTPVNPTPNSQTQVIPTNENIPTSSSSTRIIINDSSKPTYFLNYVNLENLPESVKEINIENNIQFLKQKIKLNNYKHKNNSYFNLNYFIINSIINNDLNSFNFNDHDNDDVDSDDGGEEGEEQGGLQSRFNQYFIDYDSNWNPINLWTCLENLSLVVFNGDQLSRPPPDHLLSQY